MNDSDIISQSNKTICQMPLRFVVTVDTEADDAWSRPNEIRVTNLQQLEKFQDLCDKYEVVPTYLVTYECATRDEALEALIPIVQKRSCEIGHHLHVWTTPPFQCRTSKDVDSDWIHAFQFQLPDTLFLEKAERLRQAIEDNFGFSPTSHRAGRWGIDQRTVDWLIASGFVVETSMRTGLRLRQNSPHGEIVASDNRGIAALDYELRRNPYHWPSGIDSNEAASIIEIPATVDVPRGLLPDLSLKFLALKLPMEFTLFRIFRKFAGLSMLYPDPDLEPGTLPKIIERAIERRVRVINLMLHSSELSLHCSPFTRTSQGLELVWNHLEEAFAYIRNCGIVSERISDVARRANDFLFFD